MSLLYGAADPSQRHIQTSSDPDSSHQYNLSMKKVKSLKKTTSFFTVKIARNAARSA
jgi:hypothetical protein